PSSAAGSPGRSSGSATRTSSQSSRGSLRSLARSSFCSSGAHSHGAAPEPDSLVSWAVRTLCGGPLTVKSPRPVSSTSVSSESPFRLGPAFPERAARGTADKLRAWQAEAVERYWAASGDGAGPRDFVVAATPGAGKTTFALRLATELMGRHIIDWVTVVTPTDHLNTQWADAAHRVGLRLEPGFRNSHGRPGSRHFQGLAVTYAQVALRPVLHRNITESHRTLVILDEVHHGGDALSWGDGIREAFETATRRLSLTG